MHCSATGKRQRGVAALFGGATRHPSPRATRRGVKASSAIFIAGLFISLGMPVPASAVDPAPGSAADPDMRSLAAAKAHLEAQNPSAAIVDAEQVIAHFENDFAGSSKVVYGASSPAETLMYLASAIMAKREAVIIPEQRMALRWSGRKRSSQRWRGRGQAFVDVELGKLAEAADLYRKCLALNSADQRAARELHYVQSLQLKKSPR